MNKKTKNQLIKKVRSLVVLEEKKGKMCAELSLLDDKELKMNKDFIEFFKRNSIEYSGTILNVDGKDFLFDDWGDHISIKKVKML